MEVDRPILITGVSFSGKTLLCSILKTAPEFAVQGETLSIWNIGMGRRADDRRTAEEVTEKLQKRIAGACQQLVKREDKKRYVDNLSQHAVRLPFIHRLMPEARLIHVFRSGEVVVPMMCLNWTSKDTIARAFRRRRKTVKLRTISRLTFSFGINYLHSRLYKRRVTCGCRCPGLEVFARTHSVPEIAAYQWRWNTEIFQEDAETLPKEMWMEVRFEDLIGNPLQVLRDIAAFCEVERPDNLVSSGGEIIDQNYKGRGMVELTQEEWHRVREIIKPLQKKLGYEQ